MARKLQKPIVFVLTNRKANPSLRGRHYPGYFRMPSEEEIFIETENKTRTIRYAIGETSIFKDEQPERVTLGDIIFVNGSLILDRTNPNLIKFLELSNHNEGNPARISGKRIFFRKLDEEAKAKSSVSTIIEETKAVNLALQMDFAKLIEYAKVMGIDVDRSADEIKHDMVLFARKKPKVFMDGVDSPIVARQVVINKAKERGLIIFDGRNVRWATGGKNSNILVVPVGKNVIEYFAEWTMNEKDGNDVFDEIEKRVNKSETK